MWRILLFSSHRAFNLQHALMVLKTYAFTHKLLNLNFSEIVPREILGMSSELKFFYRFETSFNVSMFPEI